MSKPTRSFFSQDLQKEQVLNEYLDDVYTQLGIRFKRVHDAGMQHKGVDVTVAKGEREFLVDEKAQLDYLDHSLPTFAFEIGYFRDGVHKRGWLFDDKKLTTHYLLITHIYLKEGTGLTAPDDIASLKILWLNRAKLIDKLESIGLHQFHCENAEKDARENGTGGKIPTGVSGYYFMLSDQKAEAPFNLVIGRDELLKIGTQLYP